MTPPDLRTLVERLPESVREGEGVWFDEEIGFWLSVGKGDYNTIDDLVAADAILGHLVRWLGERGCYIMPVAGVYEVIRQMDELDEIVCEAATPLEAAVEGVRVICGDA